MVTALQILISHHVNFFFQFYFSSDDCQFGFEDVHYLLGDNASVVLLEWPCELREHLSSTVSLVRVVRWLLYYGTAVLVAAGILCNLLAFRVLCSREMRGKTMNKSLAVLAIFDAGVLGFNFMVGVLRAQLSESVNTAFQQNEWLCLMHSVVIELFTILSVWTIVFLNIERLIAVTVPMKIQVLVTGRRKHMLLIIVTSVSFIAAGGKLFVSGFEGDSVFGYKACQTHRTKTSLAAIFYVVINTTLPTLLIVVCNILMLIAVTRSTAKLARQSIEGSKQDSARNKLNKRRARTQAKLVKTLLSISFTYLLCVLPLGITQMYELWWNWSASSKHTGSVSLSNNQDYADHKATKLNIKWIRAFFFCLYQLNFILNCFVFICTSADFRKQTKVVLCQIVSSKRPRSTASEIHSKAKRCGAIKELPKHVQFVAMESS